MSSGAPGPPAGGSKTPLILGLGAAVAVLLAALVTVLVASQSGEDDRGDLVAKAERVITPTTGMSARPSMR